MKVQDEITSNCPDSCDDNSLKITGFTKQLVLNKNQSKQDSISSEESSLTHVTEEIVEDIGENNATNSVFRIPLNQQESLELNKKCIKWLEDVARERLQNPDQIFLPHLLIT